MLFSSDLNDRIGGIFCLCRKPEPHLSYVIDASLEIVWINTIQWECIAFENVICRLCLFFSSVEYFVSSFCVEFSLQPFSICFCFLEERFPRRDNKIHFRYDRCRYLNPSCLFLRSLFAFYVLCSEKKKDCWKRRESWKISCGPYAGSG